MAFGFAPLGLVSLAFVLARRTCQVAGRIARALINRRDVHRLAELDDRTLKDIGLMRSDVVGALAEPLYSDPSQLLSLRSGGHRGRSRPMAVRPSAWQGRSVTRGAIS